MFLRRKVWKNMCACVCDYAWKGLQNEVKRRTHWHEAAKKKWHQVVTRDWVGLFWEVWCAERGRIKFGEVQKDRATSKRETGQRLFVLPQSTEDRIIYHLD